MDKVFIALGQEVLKVCMGNEEIDEMAIIADYRDPVAEQHSEALCKFLAYMICGHPNTFANSKILTKTVELSRMEDGVRTTAIGLDLSSATREELIVLMIYSNVVKRLLKN